MSPTFRSTRSLAPSSLALLAGVLALLLCSGVGPAIAASLPSVQLGVEPTANGNIDDIITFGQGLTVATGCFQDASDGKKPICTDSSKIPCAPTEVIGSGRYWVNGFDITRGVMAFDDASNQLYLGLRVAGVIGDTDGNGNPDNNSCPPATSNIQDGIGIDGNGPLTNGDFYQWAFDFNCDGTPDGLVRVFGNTTAQVEVLGLNGATVTNLAFSGSDIEVFLSNVNIELPMAGVVFSAGSNADCLGEEDTEGNPCLAGSPNITIDKSVDNPTLCPGEEAVFTIVVNNNGTIDFRDRTIAGQLYAGGVNLSDVLPANLEFVSSDNTCGVGSPQQVGQTLTWPEFDLNAGQSCTFHVRIRAGAACQGSVTNTATVSASFRHPCIVGGEPQAIGPFSDDATVTCVDAPCVTLVVNPLPAQCPGTAVTVLGTVANCSDDPETITVSIPGFAPVVFNDVPGNSPPIGFSIPVGNLDCGAGGVRSWVVTAVGDGECEPNDTKTATATIECKDVPCVTLVVNPLAAQCPGSAVTVSGTVANCSDDPETITVSIPGFAPVVFNDVPGNSQPIAFSIPVGNLDCGTGGSASYVVTAVADGDCEPNDTKTATATIECKDVPCVTLVVNPNEAQCPGTPVTVTGTVANCSDDPETITVSIPGFNPVVFSNVPANSPPIGFSIPVGNLDCGAGGVRSWVVTAVGDGECEPNDTKTATATIECKPGACVTLVVNPLPAQCPGTAVSVLGTVANCSDAVETITVSIPGFNPVVFNDVPAHSPPIGFSIPVGNLDCSPGGIRSWVVTASSPGDCPPGDTKTATATITCKDVPCVTLVVNPLPAQCPGTAVTVLGTVANCSDDPETITVSIPGFAPVVFNDVPANSPPIGFSIPVGNLDCGAGGVRSWVVTAVGDGECEPNDTKTATATIECKDVPCVTLVVNPLAAQCPGSPVAVLGTVANCSDDPETITVSIPGFAPVVFNDVPGNSPPIGFSIPVGNLDCSKGGVRSWVVTAVGDNECEPNDTKTATATIECKPGACVTLVVNPLAAQCEGTPVTVLGTVANCSDAVETITVSIPGFTPVVFNDVPANSPPIGFSIPVGNLDCENGTRSFVVTAVADGDCEPNDTKTATATIQCKVPQLQIAKTGESEVEQGATIHYTITVTNPSSDVALENVVVTDILCSYVKDPRNFGGTCVAGAPNYDAGTRTLTWPPFNLAANSSCTLTFEVTADVTVGGGQCPGTFRCVNTASASADCAGSGGASHVGPVVATHPTDIICAADNCPRTVGYWGVQCRQAPNGSTKYTEDQMTLIAECADDLSSFFNWSEGTDFERACAIINPSTPMQQRKQAKRQFMGTLFNLCVTSLDLDPIRGGKVLLDPSTPIHCDGFTSDTIGELIAEVDALLAQLEGQDLNSGSVKAKYGQIISCFDGINNGTNIPTSSDCEETSSTNSGVGELGENPGSSDVSGVAVELYRAVPNPFSASTSFAYEVSAGAAQSVEIGIYNVAGRLITRLDSGVKEPGRYSVRWDGRDAAGISMAPGVYFLKSRVGDQVVTSRLLKVVQ